LKNDAEIESASSVYLLDTSALLTLLMGEEGEERVWELLDGEDLIYVPWPALMEIYYLTERSSGETNARKRYAMVTRLRVVLLNENTEGAWLGAAHLKARYSLSFADALIASLAQRQNAILVHKDPQYDALEHEIALEPLPYKPRHR
jgi:predicted nucleic acid-binding protein